MSQGDLARALGVTQAYVSQLESGARPVSRRLAERLGALPDLPPIVVPAAFTPLDDAEADLAADLGVLGYGAFAASAAAPCVATPSVAVLSAAAPSTASGPAVAATTRRAASRCAKNPAAVIISVLARQQVAPSVMAGVPWLLLSHTGIDTAWLVDQARRRNLQNRLGFLTDLAIELARAQEASTSSRPRVDDEHLETLVALRADLETSRLANEGTLARVLTPAERQFFEEHRSAAARHWHLVTGLTTAQLPYR